MQTNMPQNLIKIEKKLIHTKIMDVRWGDMDAYGHVNNTAYFLYTQEARFDMQIKNNKIIDPQGISPILAQATCKFIRPIVYPESIKIETWLLGTSGKKVMFEHTITSNTLPEVTYAIGEAAIIWYDFKNKKSIEDPSYIIKSFLI
jgi:acyl-CoA thioester hydrolase